ncbi:MAG: hypothetical protein IJS22_02620 [Lachnospiraceae bacterium]|nr:hypothetical protein [Lachnospiraceae bacterium]
MKTKDISFTAPGNPSRNYRQDRFIISSCMALADEYEKGVSALRECIRNVKELGCNLAEFIWADLSETEKCISACEEFGIDGIFQNWDAFGGFQARKGKYELNRAEFERFMESARKCRHFYGYYVWDEPFEREAVDAAARQLNEIEKLDPNRLPFVVAIPSYNGTRTWENGLYEEYLKDYAKKIDPPVLSLDYYPFSSSRPEPENQLDDSRLFLDIALLRKLALEKSIPMWFYVQAQDRPQNEKYYCFAPEKLTMQAFNVLLHGGKAVQYYCTVEGAMYWDGRLGPLYFHMKELNRRIGNWGKTLMALSSEGVYHSPEVLASFAPFDKYREPVSNSKVLADRELPFRCSVGELSDSEQNRYLLVQNRDYKEERIFKLVFKKPVRVYSVSDRTGLQRILRDRCVEIDLDIAPGDAVFLRVQDADEEVFAIEYRPAGQHS